MPIHTFYILDYIKDIWRENQKDQFAKNICISVCMISILPFTMCYDLGYETITDCYRVEPVLEPEHFPKLRRSPRLAEKRARQELLLNERNFLGS